MQPVSQHSLPDVHLGSIYLQVKHCVWEHLFDTFLFFLQNCENDKHQMHSACAIFVLDKRTRARHSHTGQIKERSTFLNIPLLTPSTAQSHNAIQRLILHVFLIPVHFAFVCIMPPLSFHSPTGTHTGSPFKRAQPNTHHNNDNDNNNGLPGQPCLPKSAVRLR